MMGDGGACAALCLSACKCLAIALACAVRYLSERTSSMFGPKCPNYLRHPFVVSQTSQPSQLCIKIPLQQPTHSTQLIQCNTRVPVILSAAKNPHGATRGFFAALRMTGAKNDRASEERTTYAIEPLTIGAYLCYYWVGKTDNKVV